uniref:B30.2/SPRY domain-containing protein n=1 Tax=Equus caballus TaxID=9796 RepID=A0A9L0RG45_HORSE
MNFRDFFHYFLNGHYLPSLQTQILADVWLNYIFFVMLKNMSHVCLFVYFPSARRKAQFKSAWKNAPLYPDWRKEEFKVVNVTLDAATAHPVLLLSEKGRRVTWQERCQDLPSSTQRFNSLPCVLGQLDISSGRCYWEVEVGEARSWDLGICRDNVTRKERVTMSPQNGFWAIRLYDGDYWALTSRVTPLTLQEKPLIVGIFLDYEAGDVSFYNMTDGSHIFTFPQNTFYGILRPLFRLWSSDSGSLTIVQVEEN